MKGDTMTQHTPGPWNYSKPEFADGRYSIYANGPLATTASEADYGDSALPNARLIAAAPELLEALRPFAKLGNELPTGPDWELDSRPVWSFNNAVITLGEMRHARKVLDHE